VFEDLTTS